MRLLENIFSFKDRKFYIVICLAVILLYVLPLIVLKEDSYVLIHDNLDAGPVQFANFYYNSDHFYLNKTPDNILNGNLPFVKGPNFRFDLIPYFFFKPIMAYTIIQLLSRLLAFLGMYILLSYIFKKNSFSQKEDYSLLIIIFSSLCFGLLPHYPPTAFTITSLPLLTWALLKIFYNEGNKLCWSVLILIPFISSFLVAPFFLLFLFGLAWIKKSITNRKVDFIFLGALVLSGLCFTATQYDVVYSVINGNYVSHRIERIPDGKNLLACILLSKNMFLHNQYHAPSLHYMAFILIILFIFMIAIKSRFSKNNIIIQNKNILISIFNILLLLTSISIFYGLYRWHYFIALRRELSVVFDMIQWDRFYWLNPLLWWILVTLLISLILKILPRAKYVIVSICIFQIVFLFYMSDFNQERIKSEVTFKQFYASEQFYAIKRFINEDPKKYRVASLGLHPSIAVYNGFYTLDGYSANYNLQYKHSFKKIIDGELEKSMTLKDYYDNWGSRCYLFSSELGNVSMYTKFTKKREIDSVNFNLKHFKELGGRYIISSVKIKNEINSGLKLIRTFVHPDSAWDIYLYKPLN